MGTFIQTFRYRKNVYEINILSISIGFRYIKKGQHILANIASLRYLTVITLSFNRLDKLDEEDSCYTKDTPLLCPAEWKKDSFYCSSTKNTYEATIQYICVLTLKYDKMLIKNFAYIY